MSNSLQPHGLYSPGQNTGVDSLSLLQGIFPTQGLNPGLPHCRWICYQLSHKGSPLPLRGGVKFLSPGMCVELSDSLLINRLNGKWWYETWLWQMLCSSLFPLVDSLLCGEAAAMLQGNLDWEPEASCQQPREFTISEGHPPTPIKPSDDCSLSWPPDWNHITDLEPEPFS